MQIPRTGWKFLKDNAVAITPAIAYYLTFAYEKAKCGIIGIPVEFVQVELTQVLLVLSLVLGIGAPLVFFLDDALEVASPTPELTNRDRVVRQYVLAFGYLFLLANIYAYEISKLTYSAILIAILMLLDILHAKLGDKRLPFSQRLLGPVGVLTSEHQVLGVLKRRLGTWFPLLCVFLVANDLSVHLGKSNLSKQRNFLVPSTNENSVVIAKFGPQVFCSEFDTQSRQLKSAFKVIDMNSTPEIQFLIKSVGPLIPPDLKPTKIIEKVQSDPKSVEPAKVEPSLETPKDAVPADKSLSGQNTNTTTNPNEENPKQ